MIASTSRIWMKPPSVYDVTNPSNHKITRITAIVANKSIAFLLFSTPSQQMAHEAEQEQNQKDKKQNLRNSRGRNRNSRKSQNRGNQRHDEKSQRPAQHLCPSFF